jgi:hypothetical protein
MLLGFEFCAATTAPLRDPLLDVPVVTASCPGAGAHTQRPEQKRFVHLKASPVQLPMALTQTSPVPSCRRAKCS